MRSRSADGARTRAVIGVAADGVEQPEQDGLGRRAVLEVEDGPVEAGLAGQLDGQRAKRGRRRRR